MPKLEDFRRINEPRVRRALDQIGHIEKSAGSMRIDPHDVAALLQPIQTRLAVHMAGKSEPAPVEPVEALSPAVQREVESLEDLSTQQLVDRMVACGAILAARRQ